MNLRIRVLGAIAGLLILCVASASAANEVVTLRSGNQIQILGVDTINFAKDVPALMFRYQTSLNIDNNSALRREIDEIWGRFVEDVEKAKVTSAIISANEGSKSSIVSEGRAFNFIFKKVDGKWCLEPSTASKKGTKQLTEPMLNQFLALWDATSADLNANASTLYVTSDWKGVMLDEGKDGKPRTQILNWKEVQSAIRASHESLSDYKYSRGKTQIEIAPDGRSATVRSEISESMTSKEGKAVNVVTATSDVVELVNGQPLVKSSTLKLVSMQ